MSSCGRVRAILHRRTVDLPEATLIELEDHLADCTPCKQARDQLLVARELVTTQPNILDATAHRRALAKALLAGATTPRRPLATRWFVAAGALAAAAGVVYLVARDASPSSPPEPIAMPPLDAAIITPLPPAYVEAGTLARPDGTTLAGGLPLVIPLRVATDARVVLPGVTFAAARDTTFRLDPSLQAIHLDAGALEVEVDPTAAVRLRVATATFVVEVTGTVFHVSQDAVAVTRGSVRVLALDGKVLDAAVEAGERWPEEVVAPPSAPLGASVLLERARAAFARGNCDAAEQLADAALDAAPTRAQSAEARILGAECAQTRGQLDEALRRYDAIATRYRDLAVAETAAMAAARIELARGESSAARARLERYLDRYPNGRFAADALRILQP